MKNRAKVCWPFFTFFLVSLAPPFDESATDGDLGVVAMTVLPSSDEEESSSVIFKVRSMEGDWILLEAIEGDGKGMRGGIREEEEETGIVIEEAEVGALAANAFTAVSGVMAVLALCTGDLVVGAESVVRGG